MDIFIKIKRKFTLLLISIEKLSGRTEFTKKLHKITFISIITMVFLVLIFDNKKLISFLYIAMLFSALAFILEAKITLVLLYKKYGDIGWIKALYGITSLFILYGTRSFSKQVVHKITGIDPVYYSDFVNIFMVFNTILFSLIIVQAAISILGLIPIIKVFIIDTADMVWSTFTNIINIRQVQKKDSIAKKSEPIMTKKKDKDEKFYPLYSFSNLIGAMVITHLIGLITLPLLDFKTTHPYIKSLLIQFEYKSNSGCINLNKSDKVVYIGDGAVSVARWDNVLEKYILSTQKCRLFN